MFYAYKIYNVDYWSNEENCWRFSTVTGPQLKNILENPKNERVTYREIDYSYPTSCDW